MPKKPLKIIGINPGTRYLGVAILYDFDLRDWRIKVFQEKWSKEKMEKLKTIVCSFIDQYQPNVLAIKKLHPSRSSKNLKCLVARIKELSKRKGLRIHQYSIKELEKNFIADGRANKRNLARLMTNEYQELIHEFNHEKKNRNPYYIRMFEAVALASLCFNKLDNHL